MALALLAAAAHAAGVANGDGEGLREASVQLEEMGDLLAAADAAAQAAAAFRGCGRSGSATAPRRGPSGSPTAAKTLARRP